MVNIVMGPEGSGKTKLLIDAISRALKTESGRSALKKVIRCAMTWTTVSV